jgi:hypothetical protein
MSRRIVPVAIVMLALILSSTANADGRTWKDHKNPYDFLFGNHIDMHQETQLKKDGDLSGFFYVFWSDDYTATGERIAKHCTKTEHYEQGCFAGWKIEATPCIEEVNGCRAMFLYHDDDHPVWMIGPRNVSGSLRGTRSMIAQPGGYTHMHWLTEGAMHEGTLLQSSLADVEALFGVDISVPAECNVATASDLTPGTICPGYYLEIKAVENFFFKHGGEEIPVSIGIDNRTHINIVSSYRSLAHGALPPEFGTYVEDGGSNH